MDDSKKGNYCNQVSIITYLLSLLVLLVSCDVFMQYSIADVSYWNSYYELAVSSSPELWKVGFRIEDIDIRSLSLELKLKKVADIMKSIPHKRSKTNSNVEIEKSSIQLKSGDNINILLRGTNFNNSLPLESSMNPLSNHFHHQNIEQIANDIMLNHDIHLQLHQHSGNISNIVTIHCDSDAGGGGVLRVGLNDYRTDERNACHLFESSNPRERHINPHYMFEQIPLGDGAFGLKSVATKEYIRIVPPQNIDADAYFISWGVALGSPTAGAYERFRHAEDGRLFSSLLGGYLTCGGGDAVQGSSGKYGSYSRFKFRPVDVDNYEKSLELVALSDQLISTQQKYVQHHQEELEKLQKSALFSPKEASASVIASDTIRIGITIPVTSRGTVMGSIKDSPLWSNFFDTFMKSIDWRSNRICFRVYIGFDKADLIYDTGDAWSEMRDEFNERATFRMKEQLMDDIAIHSVMRDTLTLKLMHFEGLQGAPSQVVSQLMLQSYADGFDYFYQVNDDTLVITPNWAADFIKTLQSNPLVPNFGVTGPTDLNNDRIFTHCFVHRTHIDIFGYLFPPYFKNWWSDDWVSTVYGAEHTFRLENVVIKHNVESQKAEGFTRYVVDKSDKFHLDDELRLGHIEIDHWLKKKSLPRLPLPNVCGYIPLTRYLLEPLRSYHQREEQEHVVSTPIIDINPIQ